MSRLPATIVIFAGFFLIGKLFLLWGILLPDIAADLQMSEVVSGALFSLFSVGMMLGAVIGGKYASRFEYMPLLATLFSMNTALLLLVSVLTAWQWFFGVSGINRCGELNNIYYWPHAYCTNVRRKAFYYDGLNGLYVQFRYVCGVVLCNTVIPC